MSRKTWHYVFPLAIATPKKPWKYDRQGAKTEESLLKTSLSRAWCMRGIVSALAEDDPARKVLTDSAARHAESALPHVTSGDYAGEHWLASFAVYMLSTSAKLGGS